MPALFINITINQRNRFNRFSHRWMKLLETGQVKSVVDLANLLDRNISKLRKILKLADLEPVEALMVMSNSNIPLNSIK